MRLVLVIFFIVAYLDGISQKSDSLEIASGLLGEWEFAYYVNIDIDGKTDTFYVKRDTLPIVFGLIITKEYVDEFLKISENNNDTIALMGQGLWGIQWEEDTFWVTFGCEGIVLCGRHEIISIKLDEIVLKSCSKYEYDGCELIHLTRKSG